MKNFVVNLSFIILFFAVAGCSYLKREKAPDSGVSSSLAIERKELISDLSYGLSFSLPENLNDTVTGEVKLKFNLAEKQNVILDFVKHKDDSLNTVEAVINGVTCDCIYVNEHIVLPEKLLERGKNIVDISFISGDYSLNRRDDFLYTLLVPDRARTLFPCFDQPDLKAVFSLNLHIPTGWKALANGKQVRLDDKGNYLSIGFSETKPISTYLFSFVAGDFDVIKRVRGGREINMFHKETDKKKIEQADDIFSLIYSSLDWLESYTNIDYPFTKYDIAVIPGFQYGGMEHMGATLYSDRTMFLEESATITEKMSRAKLIAHETSHMWFGDYVTMKWFNDVWTKEVFANWFASAIVSPLFPDTDHRLNFINTYFPSSYAEDRTSGANAVQQNLENLNEAGLLYGNIIYNKAPIVMDKLVTKIGDSLFRKGIQIYLRDYGYSNATWDNLIKILDDLSEENLTKWSETWIKKPGMPIITLKSDSDTILVIEDDPYKRGISWEQNIFFDKILLSEGMAYGLIVPDSTLLKSLLSNLQKEVDIKDADLLYNIIQLYELANARLLPEECFLEISGVLLTDDVNIIVFSRIVSYLSSYVFMDYSEDIETMLKNIVLNSSDKQRRSMAFKAFAAVAASDSAADFLYSVWKNPSEFSKVNLGERDLTNLAYKLPLFFPDRFDTIKELQNTRISNHVRKKEFSRTIMSVSPDETVRDSVFHSLLSETNRSNEPLALQSLANLNNRLVQDCAVKYIEPALKEIEEVHYTGDIFFPARWLGALLGGHSSPEAAGIVDKFLDANENINPLLRQKILQQSHHLFR